MMLVIIIMIGGLLDASTGMHALFEERVVQERWQKEYRVLNIPEDKIFYCQTSGNEKIVMVEQPSSKQGIFRFNCHHIQLISDKTSVTLGKHERVTLDLVLCGELLVCDFTTPHNVVERFSLMGDLDFKGESPRAFVSQKGMDGHTGGRVILASVYEQSEPDKKGLIVLEVKPSYIEGDLDFSCFISLVANGHTLLRSSHIMATKIYNFLDVGAKDKLPYIPLLQAKDHHDGRLALTRELDRCGYSSMMLTTYPCPHPLQPDQWYHVASVFSPRGNFEKINVWRHLLTDTESLIVVCVGVTPVVCYQCPYAYAQIHHKDFGRSVCSDEVFCASMVCAQGGVEIFLQTNLVFKNAHGYPMITSKTWMALLSPKLGPYRYVTDAILYPVKSPLLKELKHPFWLNEGLVPLRRLPRLMATSLDVYGQQATSCM